MDSTFAAVKGNLRDIGEEHLERAKRVALLVYADKLDERSSMVAQASHQVSEYITFA